MRIMEKKQDFNKKKKQFTNSYIKRKQNYWEISNEIIE